MATREKTVTFAFPQLANVDERTETDFAQIQVYIPEASPTFTSVCAEIGFQDRITQSGGTIGEHRVGLRLGAAALTTITELDDIQHSGENMAGVIGPFDFTAHFNANWTGAAMNCVTQVYFEQTSGTTEGMRNLSCVLRVTYTYDDAAPTQIKTVAIPLDSSTGFLPTAPAEITADSIPRLTGSGGILPESNIVIRDWFIVFEGNDANTNSQDFTLTFDLSGAQAQTFAAKEGQLATNNFSRYIYKPATTPATTTTHALRASCSQATKFPHATFTLFVTYEFTLTGTTRTLNSIILPIEISSPLGANSAAVASHFSRQLLIIEPGAIVQRHSGFRINWNSGTSIANIVIRAGSQSFETYATNAAVVAGMFSVQRRISAADLPLTRGLNEIDIDAYGTSNSAFATNVNGWLIINYESDVAAAGIGAHAHTVFKKLCDWDAASQTRRVVTGASFAIPDSNYWILSAGFCFVVWNNVASNAITLDAQLLAGEGKAAGFVDIYADAYNADADQSCSVSWARGRDVFKRFPQDADADRANIEAARVFRFYAPSIIKTGAMFVVTYHTMTWEAAGNISGHDVALPTTVKLVSDTTGELMQEQVLTAGTTAFSFTVYDNTEQYYIDAYQDATHVGRSGLAQAS